MDENRDDFPEVRPSEFPRLSDVYGGDGFPSWPRTPLSAAVLRDALGALKESRGPDAAADAEAKCDRAAQLRAQGMTFSGIAAELGYSGPEAARDAAGRALAEQVKAQTRAAKEIEAAHADPNWLDGS